MEKDTRTEITDAWKKAAKEASDLILLHSWERMKLVETPCQQNLIMGSVPHRGVDPIRH